MDKKDHIEKPFYRSKKFLALVMVGLILLICSILKTPIEVTSALARALEFALPIYVAGQAYVDSKIRGAAAALVSEEVKSE